MLVKDIIYVEKLINGMAVSGLWDNYNFKQPIKKYLYKAFGYLLFFMFMFFNISQYIEMYNVKGDVQLMQNLGVTLLYALILIKAYTVLFRKKRISSLIDKIKQAEERAFKRPEGEIKIYYETMAWSWFTTKWFWFLCFITLVSFFIGMNCLIYSYSLQND